MGLESSKVDVPATRHNKKMIEDTNGRSLPLGKSSSAGSILVTRSSSLNSKSPAWISASSGSVDDGTVLLDLGLGLDGCSSRLKDILELNQPYGLNLSGFRGFALWMTMAKQGGWEEAE